MNAHQLGACLYIPATHPQLHAIARGEKLQHVRSVIYCTEDSVAPHDLPRALAQLAAILGEIPADCPRNRFIRLRDPATMRHILKLPHLERIHGFVLPKITAANLDDYAPLLDTPYRLMPTLESADTYLESAMLRLLEKPHPLPAHRRQRPHQPPAPAPPARRHPLHHPCRQPDRPPRRHLQTARLPPLCACL